MKKKKKKKKKKQKEEKLKKKTRHTENKLKKMGKGTTKKGQVSWRSTLHPQCFFLRTLGQIWCENYVCYWHDKWVVAAEIPIFIVFCGP